MNVVRCAGRFLAALNFCVMTIPCLAAPPNAFEAGVWLEGKSLQLIRNARTTMQDGTAAFMPQAGAGYDAFWLRDYAYMFEGSPEAFTDDEIRNSCLTFVNALRADGAGVDCVKLDATPIYMPGYGTMGENPVADGSQFTVDVAWRTQQRLNDPALLQQIIDPLVATMNAAPRSANGLIYIDPDKDWDRCPYGFTDSIRKTGNVLFGSLLDVRASRQLADLLESADRPTEAAAWRTTAENKAAAIRGAFWDSTSGLFRAATVKCDQPDIWGSAFAIHLGVATADQSETIAQYFQSHYDEIIQEGQVRQLPGGMYWEAGCPPDTYQNGGFWGVANGWVVEALRSVNPPMADQMVVDMVDSYQRRGVPEWIHGDNAGVGNYVASASLPLAALRELYDLPDPPELIEVGGTFLPDKNLADGAKPFAKDVINDHPEQHAIEQINDGLYGNDHSWIAGSDQSYIGIAFSEPTTFDALAFGRDNTGILNDRFVGIYTFQYTTVPDPNEQTPDADWISFGTVYLDPLFPNDKGYLRHLYGFSPVHHATAVRILVDGPGIGIDEIEVYCIPEPHTGLSAGIGVLGLLASQWIRCKRSNRTPFASTKPK